MNDREIWHYAVKVGWVYKHIYGVFPTHFGIHRFHYQLEREAIVFPISPKLPVVLKDPLGQPKLGMQYAHFLTLVEIHDEDEIRCLNQDATDWIKDSTLFDILTRHTLENH